MKELIKIIIETAYNAKEGHIPSSLSVLDILDVLYSNCNINPLNINNDNRDRIILSKGHAALAHYAILAKNHFFKISELENFGKYDSIFGGHADKNKVPGIECSTGSLGHGFPMAVGIALALKIKKSNAKVYVIIGDGECNEGTIWESALIAAQHKLNNLYCIVDYNHSNDRAIEIDNLVDKFNSFGWFSFEINGHNHKEIKDAINCFENFTKKDTLPVAIIANTIKGHRCKMMENNPEWHHKIPSKEEYEMIMSQLPRPRGSGFSLAEDHKNGTY